MNIDSTRKGERQISLRSLFTAMLLMVVALAAILGFTSTKTFAAENNSSIVPDNASEVVLTSSATGDVDQPVTDADYAKLNAQYKVTPDGTPTIQSKTQNVETLTTKDGNKDKSYTKTTTKWVISDEDKTPATAGATQVNPGNNVKVGPNVIAPIILKPSVPALLGGAVLGAVPALAAVPAAFLAGGVLPTVGALAAVPAAFVAGQAAKALPAALTGAALAAKPAFDAGKLAAAVPAVLAAKPVFDAGKLAATVPALLAAKPLFDAGKLAGLVLATVPAKIALQNLGAIHALNDPLFNIGGPILRAVKGFFNPIPEIVKDHLEDLALAGLVGAGLNVVPVALTTLALARLPLAVVGAIHALTNPFSFPFGFGPLSQLGRLVKGSLFPVAEILKDHAQDALRDLLAIPVAALLGAKTLFDLAKLPAALLALHAFNNGLRALRNGLVAAIAVPIALINGVIAAHAVPAALLFKTLFDLAKLPAALFLPAVALGLLNKALFDLAKLPAALFLPAVALGLLNKALFDLAKLPAALFLPAVALGLLNKALFDLAKLPAALFLPAVALGLLNKALFDLAKLPAALFLPAVALGLLNKALLDLAKLPALIGLGYLATLPLRLLNDLLKGLALLTLANLLNPLSPFNPFVGTGLISLALRALRTAIVAILAAVDGFLAMLLPTLASFLLRAGLALAALVPALVLGIGVLLRDVLTLNIPRLLFDVLLGVGVLLAGVGFVLAPVLKLAAVYLLSPLAVAIALVLRDAIIQLGKDILRVAIILGAALGLIGLALVDIPVILFALLDGLLDTLGGSLFVLAYPLPIGSLLGLAYVFINLTEVYVGVAGGITLFAVEAVGTLNLAALEVVSALD